MMSIDAVLPAMGGIGMRVIGTVVMFAPTAGRSVGGGVDATGRLACAGPARTVAFAQADALGAALADVALVGGADEAVGAFDAFVAGLAHATMKAVATSRACVGRR